MRRREMPVTVLDQMQVLDQEIAPALAVAQQCAHALKRLRLDLAAFGRAPGPAATLVAVDCERSSPGLLHAIRTLPESQTTPCRPWHDR